MTACTTLPENDPSTEDASTAADPDPTTDEAQPEAAVPPFEPRSTPIDTTCSPDGVGNPPAFAWTQETDDDGETYYVGELEVSEATLTLDNGETLTTRAYRQPGQAHSIPGPTIRMTPGNKYVLRFLNDLPYEPLEAGENTFKDPNASNVHTHGLHISGESPGDDVTRTFPGGHGGDFVYDIPADHMGGTYWYHAHHHGSTFLQVSGGTFGLLIIDDANDGMPANVAAMTEREVVLGYLDPGVAGTGGDTLISGTLSPTWTVNGQTSGSLCMPANEWQHYRVLVADRDAKSKTVSFGAGCEVALMARDGVWRTEVPKAMPTRSISLTGASRADFAVRCTSDSSISVGNATPATIVVGAQGDTTVSPYSTSGGTGTWLSDRPAYLRDLSGVPNNQLNTERIRMGARTVNGSQYDHHNANLTLPADAVQEWTISGAGQHPFHLHVYHVQAFGCGGDYEDGEYYDVLGASCDVRFDTNASSTTAYEGRTIMHCHILEHEDQGAMGWMNLVGGISAPTFPNDASAGFSDYYALPGGDGDGDGDVCGDSECTGSEDSCSCAADCGAPPSSELACTDGLDLDCDGLTDCDDPDCDADAACAAPFCGDMTCDVDEDVCSCSADCGAPPTSETSCTDGTDDDCDGAVDCDDADCSADAACAPPACDNDGVCEAGEDCNNCSSDCDGVVNGRPSNRYCCGDGVQDSAEGNGSICDGNY
jgi:FtsP/CotA-like multicopper oxidase with cupredoxin domain